MSEHLTDQNPENFKAPEAAAEAQEAPKNPEAHHEAAEKKPDHQEHHRAPAEKVKTKQGEQLQSKLSHAAKHADLPPPNKELRDHARNTYLVKARHHLRGPAKSFSKFVHAPTVDAVSEVSGKTIVRPSGIFVGGLFALASSAYYLHLTKTAQYKYSFTGALVMFAIGFVLGVLAELIYKALFRRRPQKR